MPEHKSPASRRHPFLPGDPARLALGLGREIPPMLRWLSGLPVSGSDLFRKVPSLSASTAMQNLPLTHPKLSGSRYAAHVISLVVPTLRRPQFPPRLDHIHDCPYPTNFRSDHYLTLSQYGRFGPIQILSVFDARRAIDRRWNSTGFRGLIGDVFQDRLPYH
ncbi:hypothetical protein HPP92_012294 [Vanilla planifolia]|uniref:Uncharacterized protein n=1 Tax=Vanilla planifolia TaxID=51239 RepID=A0A835V376_VANPL|nr:hypothetical protein HPP92_012294 [Vanilla planifolia]